jgi:hypothetical protein
MSHWPPGVSTNVRHACSGSIWRVSGLEGPRSCVPFGVTRSPTCKPAAGATVVVGADATVVLGDDFSSCSLVPHAATTSATTAPEAISRIRMRPKLAGALA